MNQVHPKKGFEAPIKVGVKTQESLENSILNPLPESDETVIPEDGHGSAVENTELTQNVSENETSQPTLGHLTSDDAQFLLRVLHTGPNKVARQADLVNLHKNLITNLKTFGSGIGDQVAKSSDTDRKDILIRLAEMEVSVNSLEGLLRIQLAPEIKKMIDTGLGEHLKSGPKRRTGKLITVFLLCAAFIAGATYSEQFFNLANDMAIRLGAIF